MASPPILKIDELTAPIAGDNPAGVPMEYLVEQELDAARKDFDVGPEGRVPRKPEWDKVKKLAAEQLQTKSKDVRLAIRLTEALVKEHGIAGLRDGLRLLRTLADQCWGRLHFASNPELNDDAEVRADMFSDSLNDPEAGFAFPHTVRTTPLVLIDNVPYSLLDKQQADRGRGSIAKEAFARAKPLGEHVVEDLKQAHEELVQLRKALEKHLGEKAPHFLKLEETLTECRTLLEAVAPAPPPAAAAEKDGAASAAPAKPAAPAAITTREEAYRQLAQIANILEKLEPHSPIPDLLRRAVELGKLPFKDLIREIVRDDKMLKEVHREFGIRDQAASEKK